MLGRSVYYVETDKDRYERMLATLYHSKEGYNINASLVCAGFAWWYERYAPDNELLESCHEGSTGHTEGSMEERRSNASVEVATTVIGSDVPANA